MINVGIELTASGVAPVTTRACLMVIPAYAATAVERATAAASAVPVAAATTVAVEASSALNAGVAVLDAPPPPQAAATNAADAITAMPSEGGRALDMFEDPIVPPYRLGAAGALRRTVVEPG